MESTPSLLLLMRKVSWRTNWPIACGRLPCWLMRTTSIWRMHGRFGKSHQGEPGCKI